jgi:large subunit ribosomal protein L24
MKKIIKGDDVVVLTGKNKGAQGKVLRVLENDKVIVENVNMVKKHTKANPQVGDPGGIVEKESPIHVSNIGLYDPTTKKAGRIGFRVDDSGKKVRYFKSSNEAVDI